MLQFFMSKTYGMRMCIYSVLKLQEDLSAQNLHRDKPKKFDHLVLGAAAGVGLPDRLQCEGFICFIS